MQSIGGHNFGPRDVELGVDDVLKVLSDCRCRKSSALGPYVRIVGGG